jgi:hypothetical protein
MDPDGDVACGILEAKLALLKELSPGVSNPEAMLR